MMGKILDSLGSFRLISLTFCVTKLTENIIQSRLVFFLGSNSILSPLQAGFRPDRSTLIKSFIYLISFQMGLINPSRARGRSLVLSTSLKILVLSGHPLTSTNFFRQDFVVTLFNGLNPSTLIGALCVVFQNPEIRSFCVRRGVAQRSVFGPTTLEYFSQPEHM